MDAVGDYNSYDNAFYQAHIALKHMQRILHDDLNIPHNVDVYENDFSPNVQRMIQSCYMIENFCESRHKQNKVFA